MLFKLIASGFKREWARLLIAVLGVGSTAGLIVWSLGLTVTTMRQTHMHATRMTRPFTCWVTTGESTFARWRRGASPGQTGRSVIPPFLDDKLVAAVQNNPEVRSSYVTRSRWITLDYRPGGRVMQGPPMGVNVALAPHSGSPYRFSSVTGQWPDPKSSEPLAAVCTSIFTPRRLEPPPLGSPLVLLTKRGTLTVKIAAYIEQKEIATGFPTLFTTESSIRELFGDDALDAGPNVIFCETSDSDAAVDSVIATVEGVEQEFGSEAGGAVLTRRDLGGSLETDALMSFKRQAPLLLTLSILTAFCMLFNALTIGVEQRLRVFGLLRTVGATSRQVAALVALEGSLIAFDGWFLGLIGGSLVLRYFVKRAAETLPEGMALGWITPLATAGGIAIVTAITLLWVCRRALRIHPLDYLAEDRNEERPVKPGRTVIGFILLFPMLILALPLPISPNTRHALLVFGGLPLHGYGLYLVMPAFVRLLENAVTPLISRLLGMDERLLRRRSSRHYPRSAGMIIMLAVGLGSFTSIHIWGGSLMSSFVPSGEFPDVIVSILPNGVASDAAAQVSQLDGVANHNCLNIEAVQLFTTPDLTEKIQALEGKPPMFSNALLMGVDPLPAFGGEKPLANFRYVAGDRHTAAKALQEGDACIITRMFSRATGLGMGDELTLVTDSPRRGRGSGARPAGRGTGSSGSPAGQPKSTPHEKSQPVAFKIAGIVDLNWHLVTSRANLRGRDGVTYGTLGPVFVRESTVRRLTGNRDKTYYLWANLSDDYRALGVLPSGQKFEADIRRALEVDSANTIRVHHRDEIEDGTVAHGNNLIGAMARAPFWSLIVLATGVVTLLVASVRASARELSIMRMIGMTRSQLGRLLLGEALTAAIGGVILSVISGLCIGWTFTGWTRATMPFGGLPMALSIPWGTIMRGCGFALLLCFIMALPSIVWLARLEPTAASGQ